MDLNLPIHVCPKCRQTVEHFTTDFEGKAELSTTVSCPSCGRSFELREALGPSDEATAEEGKKAFAKMLRDAGLDVVD